MNYLIYTIISIFFHCYEIESSHTNFEVKRFELCNGTQGLVKFYGNITKDANNKQYLSYNSSMSFDLDQNIGVVCNIFSNPTGTHFVELFAIRERNFCKALNMYMGEFWYSIERAAQLPPGVCPIRAGRYNAHHVLLDYEKISLQTFPFGRIRFILRPIDNRNSKLNLICLLMEVENYIN